ncbi:hypothetical protein KZX46_10435 [Polymorphobacter sp. PAMC 29334]|uniref:hypothetical protein n=1 Tax=Polymorphobacter sp. PAMC 29334 TaxID=2862331 RepID=UPI001C799B69|nr:hypothetical protein [Polymorphobacter sp. PAMC 29334]QYE36300.1 hypothetical protein KZX46_10435 [Polymorphobacter sp. PAMC 29334]
MTVAGAAAMYLSTSAAADDEEFALSDGAVSAHDRLRRERGHGCIPIASVYALVRYARWNRGSGHRSGGRRRRDCEVPDAHRSGPSAHGLCLATGGAGDAVGRR